MYGKQFLAAFLLIVATLAANQPLAQSIKGAQRFNNDLLVASIFTNEIFLNVFAQRFESPFGVSAFAQVDSGNFMTGEFSQCVSPNFDLRINSGLSSLFFITEGGFNCDVGEPILVDCRQSADTFAFHTIVNGTIDTPFGRQTTHGRNESFNQLACDLRAFGVEDVVPGFALKERNMGTPVLP